MNRGEIIFTHRLGEKGGYGVICGSDGKEYVFTLADVADYSGGELTAAGLRVGSLVEYHAVGSTTEEVSVVR